MEDVEEKNKNQKNVVLIVVDAFRPKNLSMFGYEQENDKNLKKIAKESVLFRKSFSTSNATAPSLNSIFSGMYPNSHGIIHQFPYTAPAEYTKFETVEKFWLPAFLKENGYETIGIDWIGLWYKRGFDYYEEKDEKQSRLKKFMKIPVVKKMLLNLPNWAYKFGKKVIKTRASAPFVSSKATADLAISKIKEAKKPFFLFAHFWDTHFPFPNTKYKAQEGKVIDGVLNKIEKKSQKEYLKKRITDINLYSVKDIINKYDMTIKNIDKEIGRIVKFLKSQGLWDDTILVVLGDHGDSLTEHGIYFTHSGLYDVSIHVPFIMRLPGVESKEVNELMQCVDIVPTILDYLGFEIPEVVEGKSLLPMIKEGKKLRDKVFFWDGLSADIRGVRTEKRKFIVAKDNACHLCKADHHVEYEEYDLEKDPEELENLYSGNSDLMESLK